PRRLVGVPEEEELKRRGDVDAVAPGRRALDLAPEDVARRGLDGPVVLVLEVAQDEGRLLEPGDGPEGRPVRHGVEVLVAGGPARHAVRSEEHTSELQSHLNLVCRLLLEKKKRNNKFIINGKADRINITR